MRGERIPGIHAQAKNWGGMNWGTNTQLALRNFPISGWKLPVPFLVNLAMLKAVGANANHSLGRLSEAKYRSIESVATDIAENLDPSLFPVDVFQTGSGTSTNMNMNEVIAKQSLQNFGVSVHPNDDVNLGQSSNDVIPTAISMTVVRLSSTSLLPELDQLIESVNHRARSLSHEVKVGRTHLMDALPLTMEQELHTWASQLFQAKNAIRQAVDNCLELPIGGTAVGTGFGCVKGFDEEVCRLLNTVTGQAFRPAADKASRMASQDHILQLSGALRHLAMTLYKISNDLRLMHSGPTAGLREIELPSLQPGSSLMPGKTNPVVCESALMVCAHVLGTDTAIAFAGTTATFQLHMSLPLLAYHMTHNIHMLSSTCRSLREHAIEGFEVQSQHLRHAVSRNMMMATALSSHIGYDAAASIVHIAERTGRTLQDVALEETDLTAEQLQTLLDPRAMTKPAPR